MENVVDYEGGCNLGFSRCYEGGCSLGFRRFYDGGCGHGLSADNVECLPRLLLWLLFYTLSFIHNSWTDLLVHFKWIWKSHQRAGNHQIRLVTSFPDGVVESNIDQLSSSLINKMAAVTCCCVVSFYLTLKWTMTWRANIWIKIFHTFAPAP